MCKVKKQQKRAVKWLDLGSRDRKVKGPDGNPEPGWVYNDLYKTDALGPDDIIYDCTKIDDVVEAGSVEKLSACHLLEHFSHRMTQDILETWYKIMANGGQIYIEVPNLMFHIQLAAAGRLEEAITYMYGSQDHEGDAHHTGFTPETIHRHLQMAGFKNIMVGGDSTLIVTATK